MFVNFIFAAVKAGTPLLFGTTGEILTERAGNLNLGVEGMMYMGAFGGFYVGLRPAICCWLCWPPLSSAWAGR